MRFMILLKGQDDGSRGIHGIAEEPAIARFRDQLFRAGVLLAEEGVCPTSLGKPRDIPGSDELVTGRPIGSTTDEIVGFWIIQVRSDEEAMEWARRVPASTLGVGSVEVRQLYEPSGSRPTSTGNRSGPSPQVEAKPRLEGVEVRRAQSSPTW